MRGCAVVAVLLATLPAMAAEPAKKAEEKKAEEKKPWQSAVTVEGKKSITLAVKHNGGKDDYDIEFRVMRLKAAFSPPACSVDGDWKKSAKGKGEQPVAAKFPQDFATEDLKGNFVWQAVVNGETVASGTMRRS